MLAFAADACLEAWARAQQEPGTWASFYDARLALQAIINGIWLGFAVNYAREDRSLILRRAWPSLLAVSLLPVAVMILYPAQLAEIVRLTETNEIRLRLLPAAKVVNGALLLGAVLILMNLERTFRAAVGTTQWRIKFLVLGLAVVFGARIYTRSQALIFSGHSTALLQFETIAVIVGCALIAIAYFRRGFEQMEVYPSRAVLHTSLTVLLVGSYLFVVGVLAQLVARSGGAGSFQLVALLVLCGVICLAVLLLSERLRQRLGNFVSHHFQRPRYDSRLIWSRFTESASRANDEGSLCFAAVNLIAQTFNIMSAAIWLFDENRERLTLCASTSPSRGRGESVLFSAVALSVHRKIFSLERRREMWAEDLRSLSESQFQTGGDRLCVPIIAAERCLGVVLLADRVRGVAYSLEELELLQCIGDQIASGLLNLQLGREILLAKELEAFQTISAFFVHDLKNAASTLNLMLQNLPVHFDNPEFRRDALRSIGETSSRINQIIERLSSLRNKLELRAEELDLNVIIQETIGTIEGDGVEVVTELQAVPPISADREQLRSVVTNLLLNARDALGGRGRIEVRTAQRENCVTLAVEDNGAGMTPEFVRDSLFRPFKTTKKKGIGIGMFQTKIIVEAHGGSVRVKSELEKGTSIQVALPCHRQTV